MCWYTNEGPAAADDKDQSEEEPPGGMHQPVDARGGKVEVTDIFSVSDITKFLMRWNHLEHCLTPCTVGDLGVGSRAVGGSLLSLCITRLVPRRRL